MCWWSWRYGKAVGFRLTCLVQVTFLSSQLILLCSVFAYILLQCLIVL